MFEQSLSYSDFHVGSDCEIHLFVLPKYQQYPKVKLPRSRFEIHSLGLDSLKVIL